MRSITIIIGISMTWFNVIAQNSGVIKVRKCPIQSEEIAFQNIPLSIQNGMIWPQYPDGEAAFISLFTQNFILPKYDNTQQCYGSVNVQFTVTKTGKLTDFKFLNRCPTIEKEAIRVLKLSPNWIPGSINGIPADATQIFPLRVCYK